MSVVQLSFELAKDNSIVGSFAVNVFIQVVTKYEMFLIKWYAMKMNEWMNDVIINGIQWMWMWMCVMPSSMVKSNKSL